MRSWLDENATGVVEILRNLETNSLRINHARLSPVSDWLFSRPLQPNRIIAFCFFFIYSHNNNVLIPPRTVNFQFAFILIAFNIHNIHRDSAVPIENQFGFRQVTLQLSRKFSTRQDISIDGTSLQSGFAIVTLPFQYSKNEINAWLSL